MNSSDVAIQVEGLSHDYHGSPSLTDVSFTVRAGERIGLVGPNGAGKSTLLLHLNGLLGGSGDAGRVTIHGIRVGKDTLGEIRRRVGLVFSDPEDQLFMPTLREDAAFGPLNLGKDRDEALALAADALGTMRLEALAERSPHHLSDGERRRAAIATVLSMRPKVWVLDEPAANLDPRGRRELVSVLEGLEGTVLLASHDLDLVVQVCERCLLLDAGCLVTEGPVREVLGDLALMERHGLEVPWRLRAQAGTKEPG